MFCMSIIVIMQFEELEIVSVCALKIYVKFI